MSLNVKPQIRQIKTGKYDVIWPGDSAVDLSASDLNTWIIEGEDKGLVLKEGVEVDRVKMIPVGSRAMNEILPIVQLGSVNQFVEAFRFSCVRIPGVELDFSTISNVRCLSDKTIDYLLEEESLIMSLPFNKLLREFFEMQDMTVDWNEEKDKSMLETPLVMVLGAQALIRSFRASKNNR